MVKSVVKPLKMRFLRERIVPKKSVFTRAFCVFCFEIPWMWCLAPKAGTLPTELRLDVTKDSIAQRSGFVNSFLKNNTSVAYWQGSGGRECVALSNVTKREKKGKTLQKGIDKRKSVWYTMQAVEGKPKTEITDRVSRVVWRKRSKKVRKTFEKPIDKRKEMWYNTKVAENKRQQTQLLWVKRSRKESWKNLKKLFKNPLTNEKRCAIIIRLSHRAAVR